MVDERELTEAVRQILSQLFQLTDRGFPSQRITRIRRETIYFIYERSQLAKFDFDRPHSARARAMHREARAAGKKFDCPRYPITYDHAIPLTTLDAGLRLSIRSPDEFRNFMERHIKGVVILAEEDALLNAKQLRQKMPPGASPDDALARYRAAGIMLEEVNSAKLTGRTV